MHVSECTLTALPLQYLHHLCTADATITTEAEAIVCMAAQIGQWAAETHRNFVATHLEAWHRHAEGGSVRSDDGAGEGPSTSSRSASPSPFRPGCQAPRMTDWLRTKKWLNKRRKPAKTSAVSGVASALKKRRRQ